MATLKELMGDLKRGDGRLFTAKGWETRDNFEPIFLDRDGYWHGLDRDGDSVEQSEHTEGFYEVKKTKIIKMYSPIIDGYEKNYCSQGEWHTDKTNWAIKPEIKGWLELEVEVDE